MQAEPPTERKPRKSVAFEDTAKIVDEDGQVIESIEMNGGKSSAESHAAGRLVPLEGQRAYRNVRNAVANTRDVGDDKDVDEVTDMFADLAKKKKKKSKPKEGDEGAEADFGALKKKKKSKKPKAEDEDDFEAQIKAAAGGDKAEAEPEAGEDVEEGDMEKGTGIWTHDSQRPIPYNMLLNRFFTLLHSQHPDLASSGSKSYKIPPPQCLREGNKKTIFANISEICKRMKRTDEHGTLHPCLLRSYTDSALVTQFLFAELGTSGSVDGSRRLVIKGRFQQKQIE